MDNELKDCRWPWNRLYISNNGDVKPCCYATLPIGNIASGVSPTQIWNGREMASLRESIKNNKMHSVCVGASCAFVRGKVPTGRELAGMAKYGSVPAGVVTGNTETLARLGQASASCQVAAGLIARRDKQRAEGQPWHVWGRTYMQAMLWYHRAGKNGSELANYQFAFELFRGPLNKLGRLVTATAHRYALRSAEAGYGPAYVLLGTMHFYGFGGPADLNLALEMFRKAAEAGDPTGYQLQGNILKLRPETSAEGDRLIALAARRGIKPAGK